MTYIIYPPSDGFDGTEIRVRDNLGSPLNISFDYAKLDYIEDSQCYQLKMSGAVVRQDSLFAGAAKKNPPLDLCINLFTKKHTVYASWDKDPNTNKSKKLEWEPSYTELWILSQLLGTSVENVVNGDFKSPDGAMAKGCKGKIAFGDSDQILKLAEKMGADDDDKWSIYNNILNVEAAKEPDGFSSKKFPVPWKASAKGYSKQESEAEKIKARWEFINATLADEKAIDELKSNLNKHLDVDEVHDEAIWRTILACVGSM